MPEEKELRIDLPVKAFVPPGWVAQEALRLELYRRISLAGDHAVLRGSAPRPSTATARCPGEVETLFAIASLRHHRPPLGVEEIATFRDQVRVKPVAIPDALRLDLPERVPEASFHPKSRGR